VAEAATSAPGPTDTGATVGALVAATAEALSSRAEARWVVAHALGTTAARLVARHDDPAAPAVARSVASLVARRLDGEPLQYVLGTWDFRTLELAVDPRVLIPRPETEQLVEVALGELRRARAAPGSTGVVADLGTGSGAVGLSIAAEAEGAALEVWLTDLADDALAVARANLARMALRRPRAAEAVRVAHGSWLGALPRRLAGRLDLIVSNPPYVAAGEWGDLDAEVRGHEPRGALVSGPTGTEDLEAILGEARPWLTGHGRVVLELAPAQADGVRHTASALGYGDVAVHRDLAGRWRVLVATGGRPGPAS